MKDLFAAPDFAWSIRMRREAPETFFARRDPTGALLDRRTHWLDTAPELCLALDPIGHTLVEEFRDEALRWGLIPPSVSHGLEDLGRRLETDFILLDSATFTMAGGCVCFPSSWNLQESTGRSLSDVHGIVPGLTSQIGPKIDRFLRRLPAGQAFLRENWGLTRSAHLNYHPSLKRPRIEGPVPLSDVYLRIEHQAFIRLPGGVLLGIRIEPVALEEVVTVAPETARYLGGQLRTMPREVAAYKGLEAAKTWLPSKIESAL